MSRTSGLLALVLSAWLSGLVVAAGPLDFVRPYEQRHPSRPFPVFEPPAILCEAAFASSGCNLREDLSVAESEMLEVAVTAHAREVDRWRGERRPALLTGAYWRDPWPWWALGWTALAALLARRIARG